jgi:uncharacterized protein (TIGR03083 family)
VINSGTASQLARAAADRTDEIVKALSGDAGLPGADLDGPSRLEGWSRLTILCHLRYGARASRRMTEETLQGRAGSFYPEGRSSQRPSTLAPEPGEDPPAVVGSLAQESRLLQDLWSGLSEAQWDMKIVEPARNPDFGAGLTIGDLATLRLTEVEVHGFDLDVGLDSWSDVFVDAALPMRLGWLATRRSNHSDVDRAVQGSWKLVASDGPTWIVEVKGKDVSSWQTGVADAADAIIGGSSRDLLAMLVGRPTEEPLLFDGDVSLAKAFKEAFPGP